MPHTKDSIEGVVIKPLRRIVDNRGWLMEIFRSDWPEFQKFGQTYMTTCKPGVIKAWHYHKLQWDHFVPIKGNALVGLYDSREGSPTKGIIQEVEVWEKEPKLVKIPPLVYHCGIGFRHESPGALTAADLVFLLQKAQGLAYGPSTALEFVAQSVLRGQGTPGIEIPRLHEESQVKVDLHILCRTRTARHATHLLYNCTV